MRKWSVHALALAAVMQWGVAQAQDAADDVIPPSPEQNQSDQNQEQPNQDEAAPLPEQEETAPAPEEQAVPPTPEEEAAPSPQAEPAPALEAAGEDQNQPRPEQTQTAPPQDPRPQVGTSDPAATPPVGVESQAGGAVQISPRVRDATANLDIDDATRARYRWQNGEWWFQSQSGTWKFHRDGEWHDFDPTTYQPIAGTGGRVPPFQGGGGSMMIDGNSPAPLSTRSANSYYYDAPSYRPVPSPGVVYGTGYRYGGRYYDGSRRFGPYHDGHYHGTGYRGYGPGYTGFQGRGYYGRGYNPGNDRYYGRDAFGRGYSIDGDRYRGGVIGSQIGGEIGGGAGAAIGGAIGAEAAD